MLRGGDCVFENYRMIEPLFEDQVHECQQFSLEIEGEEYTGIIENGKISWYHPQPQTVKTDEQVKEIEVKVQQLIQ